MNWLLSYIRNLFVLAAIILGALVFMRLFYPDTLTLLPAMGEIIGALKLWPVVTLMILAFLLPSRKRN